MFLILTDGDGEFGVNMDLVVLIRDNPDKQSREKTILSALNGLDIGVFEEKDKILREMERPDD